MNEFTELEESLLMSLGVGRENAATAREIPINSRRVRMLVSSLRKKAVPICSGDEGYWLAKDLSEIYQTRMLIDSRIKELMKVSRGLSIAILLKSQEKVESEDEKN